MNSAWIGKLIVSTWILIFLGCVFQAPQSYAQVAGGTILGTVTDPSGGAVIAAEVVITDLATRVVRTTTSNSAGSYAAPNLLPGRYEIRVTAQGFSVATVKDVILTVGAQQEINVALSVGNVSEKAQVNRSSETVDLA